MLKILHTADWHLGKRLQEFSRLNEQKDVLEEIVAVAERENVDLVLVAGDIFDTFNPSHEAVELLYKTLRKLSKDGNRPVVVISGNHDSPQLVAAPDPLARELGILFYSRYDHTILPARFETGLEILRSEPGFVEIKLPAYPFPVRLILAPYANELLLRAYLGEENREEGLRKLLESNWKTLAGKYCDSEGVNLFMGHFFFMKEGEIPPKEPESERPILHVGGVQAIYTRNIPSQIQYAALGHLHRYHACDSQPCPVVYSGSPLAYSFSEAGQQKQVVIVTAQPDTSVSYKPIPLQEGKPLYRKTFDNLPDTLQWLDENPYCYVEITYVTAQAIDSSVRQAIMKSHEGIVSLIPQILDKTNEQNQELSAEDLSGDMVSLFTRFYQSSRGTMPNDEILDLFKEVISQTQAE